jgi:hypothetical protein
VQAVDDGVFAAVNEVEEPTDFGEGERDKATVDGGRGFRCGWFTGCVVVLA